MLKGRPKTIHLFIHAPRDYRIKRIMKADNTAGLRGAQERVDESDRTRTKFIRDMVGTEWMDARNYHLSVDSSMAGLSEILGIVIGFARTALG